MGYYRNKNFERRNKMVAQWLYDFQAEFQMCSGEDLRNFFFEETGDPSPSGEVLINQSRMFDFVLASLRHHGLSMA
jgi:hypothetical protein